MRPAVHLLGPWPLIVAAGLLVSCDTPQERGLRELAKEGIEPTGLALLDAVTRRDERRAGWLLDVGVHTEQCDAQGRTPLRIALENGDISSFSKLIDAGAKVDPPSADGTSLLGIALNRGKIVMAEKLLAAGAPADGQMPDGEKILPWSIRQGHGTIADALLKSGADPQIKDRAGNPLLHIAIHSGHRGLADSLIALGADPAALNAAGETTLEAASHRGWLDALARLAEAGADPNVLGRDGLTLLERAISKRDLSKISLLLKIGADPHLRQSASRPTPLEFALREDLELFAQLFGHVTEPPPGSLDSLLHTAVETRQPEIARQLLRRGARASRPGPGGHYLVERATLAGQGSFVKMLIDHGNPAGKSLYYAAARGDADLLSLLISCGQPVDFTRVPSRETPLSAAIRGRHDRAASLLIRAGANIRLRLPEGQTPLHLAVATGCSRAVKELLDVGADPDSPFELPVSADFLKVVRPGIVRWVLKNDRRVTPLMVAADLGDIPTARYLSQAGADKAVWTKDSGLWPINFASRRNDVKMMRLFLGRDPHVEERHIEIRLSEQRARLFDAEGTEIFTTRVSTGKSGFATPTGEFVITNKYRDWKSTLYDAKMPYFQRLNCGDFGLHAGNVPGYPASHGCIRVPPGDAAKLFSITRPGDRVKILP